MKGKPGFAFCFCSYTVKLVLVILSKLAFFPSNLKIVSNSEKMKK